MPGLEQDSKSYLGARLAALRRTQNSDGGWGYFAGKESWLEPTAYAAMALAGEAAADRAWKLLSSWQLPDGSWKPAAEVKVSSWGTSLCATIAMVRNEWGQPLEGAVKWLVASSGVESNWLNVAAARLHLVKQERGIGLKSWPWKPGNSGWVEPTVHAIVALKQASAKFSSGELRGRVKMGEAQLMDVRSRDGGWNYGSPAAVGVDLPSYPETTALALVALQGRDDLGKVFDLARRQIGETPSPMARAWLAIAMRLHGVKPVELTGEPQADLMITAIEALAAAEGNYHFMKTANWTQVGRGNRLGVTA
ncbi:MAG: hypothetical protein ABI833_23155 [Acidobacteriota bacterium]